MHKPVPRSLGIVGGAMPRGIINIGVVFCQLDKATTAHANEDAVQNTF